MPWIIDWMSMLIAPWISDFATECQRAVAILKLVVISLHRDGRVHHASVLLGLNLPVLPVCSFHPNFSSFSLDFCLLPAPETSRSQTLVFIWLPEEFVEMHILLPIPFWPGKPPGNQCWLTSISEAGLGVSLWKELAEVDVLWDTRL